MDIKDLNNEHKAAIKSMLPDENDNNFIIDLLFNDPEKDLNDDEFIHLLDCAVKMADYSHEYFLGNQQIQTGELLEEIQKERELEKAHIAKLAENMMERKTTFPDYLCGWNPDALK